MNFTLEDDDLVRRNVFSIYSTYRSAFNKAQLDSDDALSAGYRGWMRAIDTHDPTLAPLEPWIFANIKWMILTDLREAIEYSQHHELVSDIEVYEDLHHGPLEEHKEVQQLVFNMSQHDQDISLLFIRMYGDYSLEDMEAATGLSRTTLWRRMKLAKSKLERNLEPI